jgi:hypothetical protein
MIYSLHSQLVFNGEETIADFKEAFEISKVREKGEAIPQFTRIKKKHIYTQVARYNQQVRRFSDLFEKDRIHFIFYEDFKENTVSIFKNTLRFLGVDSNFEPSIQVINANKKVRNVRFQNFIRKASDIAILKSVYKMILPGKKIRQKTRQFLRKMNSQKAKRQELDPAFRRQLTEFFRQDIEELEAGIGKKLEHWK